MKVMIIGAYPSGNKGGEAMLQVVVQNLVGRINGLSFFFESISKNEDFSDFNRGGYEFELNKFNAKNIIMPYSLKLDNVECIIDIGGLVYTDKSIRDNLRSFIKHFSLIIRRKKIIFFTQDFGPAKKLHTRFLGGFIMRRAIKVFVRSEYSRDVVENVLKVKKEKILGPFPDSTFLLNSAEEKELTGNLGYVVISPSAILYNSFGQEYLKLMDALINYLSKKYKVYLLIHTFTKNGQSSDREVAYKVRDLNNKAVVMNENVAPTILKKFLSDAKFVLASRYHVVVGAMSCSVPAIAIGWNPKYESFLGLYGMEEYSIRLTNDSYDNILKVIKEIEAEYFQLKSDLTLKNKKLSLKVEKSFNELSDCVELCGKTRP